MRGGRILLPLSGLCKPNHGVGNEEDRWGGHDEDNCR